MHLENRKIATASGEAVRKLLRALLACIVLGQAGGLAAQPEQGLVLEYGLSRVDFEDKVFSGDSAHVELTLAYAINPDYEVGFTYSNNYLFSASLDEGPDLDDSEELETELRLLYLRRNWRVGNNSTAFVMLGYAKTELKTEDFRICLFFCTSLLDIDTTYRNKESGAAWGVGMEWQLASDSSWSLRYVDYSQSDLDFSGLHLGFRLAYGAPSTPTAPKPEIQGYEFKNLEPDGEALGADANGDSGGPDLSGTYRSEITSNSHWAFAGKYRALLITFEQDGRTIIATDPANDVKIHTWVQGDEISFEMEPGAAGGFYSIIGSWHVYDDGARLEGRWQKHGQNGSGTWNLQRID